MKAALITIGIIIFMISAITGILAIVVTRASNYQKRAARGHARKAKKLKRKEAEKRFLEDLRKM